MKPGLSVYSHFEVQLDGISYFILFPKDMQDYFSQHIIDVVCLESWATPPNFFYSDYKDLPGIKILPSDELRKKILKKAAKKECNLADAFEERFDF